MEFLAGGLTPAEMDRVDEHCDSCTSCRLLVRAVARSSPDDPSAGETLPGANLAAGSDLGLSPTAADLGPAIPRQLDGGIERGAKLGRYLILDVLGKGGMGVVYSAFDPELDRKVALKLLRPELGGEAGAQRLLREGRAIAKLAHPNVVTVFDVGTHDGAVFVAMELVEGRSLDAWLDEALPAWREAVAVFLQAGEGLVAAHAAGMVHRDFKPANVLLGKDGRARVTDFGLARFGEPVDGTQRTSVEKLAAGSGDARLTRTGAIVGTPAYMAPEQFEAREVDANSDQFSFAVSLYEALFAQRPFAGTTVSEIFANIVDEKIRPVPAGSTVPAAVRAIVLRGLRPKSEDRYPSLAAMLADLRTAVAPRRRRVWIVAGATLALGAAAGAAMLLRHDNNATSCELAALPTHRAWNETRVFQLSTAFAASKAADSDVLAARVSENLDAYAMKLGNAFVDACTATNVRHTQSAQLLDLRTACLNRRVGELAALVDLYATTTNPKIISGSASSSRQLSSIDGCNDTKALSEVVPPPPDPATRKRLDDLQTRFQSLRAKRVAGDFKGARPEADALAEATKTLDYPPFRARVLFELADIMVRMGEIEKADPVMEESIELAARGRDHQLVAMGYVARMTNVGQNMGKYDKGLELANVAIQANDLAGSDPRVAAQIYAGRARMYAALDRRDDAVADDKKSLDIRLEKFADDPLFVARGRMSYGISVLAVGNEAEAETQFEAAKTAMEKALNPNHPELIALLTNYGELMEHKGEYQKARELNERAIAIAKRTFGDANQSVFAPMNNLGSIAFAELRYKDAVDIYLELKRLGNALIAPDHPFHGVVLGNLGKAYAGVGETTKAREALEQSIAHLEKTVGPTHEALAEPVLDLAKIYEASKNKADRKRADAMFARAIELDGELSSNGASNYGQALLDRGDARRAHEILVPAVANLDKRNKHSPFAETTRFRLAQARWLMGKHDAQTRQIVVDAIASAAKAEAGAGDVIPQMRAWLDSHHEPTTSQRP